MAGRPSDIDKVIGTRTVDGNLIDVTVADRIIDALRVGNFFEQACAQAGIVKETAHNWLRIGAKVLIRAAGRPVDDLDELSDHERRCAAFSVSVAEADALWEVRSNADLERLGRGGIPIVTTTEKEELRLVNGQEAFVVVERTTRTTASLPDAQVLQWRLSRRHPDRYGTQVGIVVNPAALSLDDQADALLTGLEDLEGEYDAFLAGAAAASAVAADAPPADAKAAKSAPRPKKPRAPRKAVGRS